MKDRRTTSGPGATLRLRPPTALPVLVGLGVLGGLVAGRPGPVGLLVLAGLGLLAAPLVLPRLEVSAGGLVVDGVLRRHVVPWSAVEQVRQAWFVVLDLSDGTHVTVLAAPVVTSMVEFRTWTVGDDDMFLRDSTRRRVRPGVTRSPVVERIEACRPVGPVTGPVERPGADGSSTTVRTRWRSAVLVGVVLAVVGGAVLVGAALVPPG